jgi:hypothetical protein
MENSTELWYREKKSQEAALMGVMRVELPAELAGPIESKASELNVDASRFVAAIVREKLKLPVAVGELDVFVPADILDYEMERAPGESDEEFEAARAAYNALFTAALR